VIDADEQDLTADQRLALIRQSLDQFPFIFAHWEMDIDRLRRQLELALVEVKRMRVLLDEITGAAADQARIEFPPCDAEEDDRPVRGFKLHLVE